jgi:uncharacterized protein YjcR
LTCSAAKSSGSSGAGKYRQSGNEADLNPNVEKRNAGPKKAKRPNLITREMAEQLKAAFERECFHYQLRGGRIPISERASF